jgi:hypothetical protein
MRQRHTQQQQQQDNSKQQGATHMIITRPSRLIIASLFQNRTSKSYSQLITKITQAPFSISILLLIVN